ncbi:tachykinin-like peptides receptor 86C [Actinia tenebrosa]|uniref:Tachykinin-like peptides receptor 86C n=1 Tax=Actinia tenebrosa TaxID=6105 RepID=A0A6P8J0D3_ACTTE|nr:tachykinin-like peptides receptor 86C [Actinia tenebrosa]
MSSLNTNNTAVNTGVTVTLSALIVVDLIGNTLVILIILTNKSMKSPINYLLVNLAVADIMVGVFLAPRFILNQFYIHPDGFAGKMMCSFLTGGNFSWVGAVASSFSLVTICCERYEAVLHPFASNRNMSKKKSRAIVVLCWTIALVLNVPLFLTKIYKTNDKTCGSLWPKEHPWFEATYLISWSVIVGIIPIAIMLVLYSRVIYSLWFKQHQVQGTQLAVLKSRKRVTKMVVIVSVVYALFCLPDFIIHLLIFSGNTNSSFKSIHLSFIILMVCNSAINPFIYTLQSGKFRRHFKRIFCCTDTNKVFVDVNISLSAAAHND